MTRAGRVLLPTRAGEAAVKGAGGRAHMCRRAGSGVTFLATFALLPACAAQTAHSIVPGQHQHTLPNASPASSPNTGPRPPRSCSDLRDTAAHIEATGEQANVEVA